MRGELHAALLWVHFVRGAAARQAAVERRNIEVSGFDKQPLSQDVLCFCRWRFRWSDVLMVVEPPRGGDVSKHVAQEEHMELHVTDMCVLMYD